MALDNHLTLHWLLYTRHAVSQDACENTWHGIFPFQRKCTKHHKDEDKFSRCLPPIGDLIPFLVKGHCAALGSNAQAQLSCFGNSTQ